MSPRIAAGLASALILAGCTTAPSPPITAGKPSPAASQTAQPPISKPVASPAQQLPPALPQPVRAIPAAPGANAAGLGVSPGPNFDTLGIAPERAAAALAAFRASCPALLRRPDGSGLTAPQDWTAPCEAASDWPEGDAAGFFASRFETAVIGDGKAFATGYYEPEIRGARSRMPGYETPIYRRPPELIDVDLGAFSESLKGKRISGMIEGRRLVPYAERKAIDDGALAGRGLELGWAADPVELFFLHIQGSGRLILPDGGSMRIGYDGQNGRDFTGLGRMLLERGVLPPGQASMQGIMAYLRAQPDGGRALMHENRSYIFFRELSGGPVGALGVEVVGRVSAAADPLYVPLGAPFIVALDRPEANGLWVAQDTGGAIKGANRFDTFWGAGAEARDIAGGMAARGQAWLLLPKGTLTRLQGGAAGGRP